MLHCVHIGFDKGVERLSQVEGLQALPDYIDSKGRVAVVIVLAVQDNVAVNLSKRLIGKNTSLYLNVKRLRKAVFVTALVLYVELFNLEDTFHLASNRRIE